MTIASGATPKAVCIPCFVVAISASVMWLTTWADLVFAWGFGWNRNYLWIAPIVVFTAVSFRSLADREHDDSGAPSPAPPAKDGGENPSETAGRTPSVRPATAA